MKTKSPPPNREKAEMEERFIKFWFIAFPLSLIVYAYLGIGAFLWRINRKLLDFIVNI